MNRDTELPISHVAVFVVQAFAAVKGGRGSISPEAPIRARDHDHALRLFERLRTTRAGVVAYRRAGSPDAGAWGDAVIIARHGVLPADMDELADASADRAAAV